MKLEAGDELFAYYAYTKNEFPDDFPWYWELKDKFEEEQRKKQIEENSVEN